MSRTACACSLLTNGNPYRAITSRGVSCGRMIVTLGVCRTKLTISGHSLPVEQNTPGISGSTKRRAMSSSTVEFSPPENET